MGISAFLGGPEVPSIRLVIYEAVGGLRYLSSGGGPSTVSSPFPSLAGCRAGMARLPGAVLAIWPCAPGVASLLLSVFLGSLAYRGVVVTW